MPATISMIKYAAPAGEVLHSGVHALRVLAEHNQINVIAIVQGVALVRLQISREPPEKKAHNFFGSSDILNIKAPVWQCEQFSSRRE